VKATFITRGGSQGLACDGKVIVLVDMKQGKAIQKMEVGRSLPQTVAIAPDGSLVVVNEIYAIKGWEIQSGRALPAFQDKEIQWYAVFLPNSRYILSGGHGKVNVWEASTQRKIYELETAGGSYVQTIACAPDNRHFAAASGSSGRELQVFRLPAGMAAD
jgi:WD40 repeat protein